MQYSYCTDNHWFWPMGLFFLILAFFLFSRLLWWGHHPGHYHDWHNGGHKDHNEILKQRYASGEITKEEFDKIKKDLNG